MPRNPKPDERTIVETLENLLIVQLGLAGVTQARIRAIVGCNIGRVNAIVRYLKPKAPKET
jgi:hypothetical protein